MTLRELFEFAQKHGNEDDEMVDRQPTEGLASYAIILKVDGMVVKKPQGLCGSIDEHIKLRYQDVLNISFTLDEVNGIKRATLE